MAPLNKAINIDQLLQLCELNVPKHYIQHWFSLTSDELKQLYNHKDLKPLIAKHQTQGKIKLLKKQFELALKGDARMLILLGKHLLKQNVTPNNKDYKLMNPPNTAALLELPDNHRQPPNESDPS